MPLTRLSVQYLRNLAAVDIVPSERVNFFYGLNGSGKTSVLEAISILGMGRSFRSPKHKPLITLDKPHFTVFGKVADRNSLLPVGVRRDRDGGSMIKVNGSAVSSASSLAEHLPVQVINAYTFQLLEGSPKIRRQFIDWLVFHVEPEFLAAWKGLQRCLKHRNSLLRRGRINPADLAPWDHELALLGEKIHQFRLKTQALFLDRFLELVTDFVAVDGLKVNYYRGWEKDKPYSEALRAAFEGDIRQGYTRLGPQRADLRITVNGQLAAEMLSRGQQKLLVCALRIAQGYVFQQVTGRQCLYLIDDLPSELDLAHQQLLAYWLDTLGSQVFVTGVEKGALISAWARQKDTEQSVFHVEQGQISVIN